MSCAQIDDLEDLAANLFEFDQDPVSESREKATKDRMLKKQQRREKIKLKQEAKAEE